MSFWITYSRLFEFRILHEYFLAEDVDTLFFNVSETPPAGERSRIELLMEKLNTEQYNVKNHIEIIPTQATREVMRNYRMRFISTGLGAFVAMETIAGVPKISLPDDLQLSFILKTIDPDFFTISQGNFVTQIPVSYYLTNRDPDGLKTFPSLAAPIPAFDAAVEYQMGELAEVGGAIQTARVANSDSAAGNWDDVGDFHYINEADRYLTERKFSYTLAAPSGVTEASFILLEEGTEIHRIEFEDVTNPEMAFILDFSTRPDPSDPTIILEISNGTYTLIVEANGIEVDNRLLILDDEWHGKDHFGLVDIHLNADNPDFDLLTAGAVKDPHPVFEVRIKNRYAYFRYNRRDGFSDDEVDDTEDFLDDDGLTPPLQLTSTDPRSMIVGPTIFDDATYPSPVPMFVSPDTDRVFADIYISNINPLI